MSRLQGRRKNKYKRFRDAAYDYIKVNGSATTTELMSQLPIILGGIRGQGRKFMPKCANSAGQMMVRDDRFSSRPVPVPYMTTTVNSKEWYIDEE